MAGKGGKGGSLLCFIFLCHAVSFLLFCRGFMLKRVVVPEYSQCQASHHTTDTDTPPLPSCSQYPRPFRRVLWLLIDALRYDFAVYDPTLTQPPVFRNKMPFVRDLLQTRPANARLFKFVADPPTTTMQRLKALTTGSLPTFIDIGSNFNSYAVSEDSLPHQARQNGRNVTFIGDDTWLGLYPDMLTRTLDYPSLNVQDLDTVDNGVKTHLEPELERGDAEIVIGHMLGVDHVGHTYGPSHWIMGEKLTQMNDYIEHLLTEVVEEDTLVFVFGDHGMSPTGDHGGETGLETDAALLVYSTRPLFDPSEPAMGREVYQIDLVPTTALAVGLPIPFSNLGTVIPEVLLPFQGSSRGGGEGGGGEGGSGDSSDGFSGRVTPEFLEALQINAEQLHKYLETYAQYSQDFPAETFSQLESNFRRAVDSHEEFLRGPVEKRSQHNMTHIASEYVRYAREVKAMCQSIWAKFDGFLMNQGLALLVLMVAATPLVLLDVRKASDALSLSIPVGLKLGVLLTGVLTIFTGLDFSLFGLVIVLVNFALISLVATLLTFCYNSRHVLSRFLSGLSAGYLVRNLGFLQLLSVSVVLLHAASMLSNSFILYEADMLAFFIQSLVFCFALRTLKRTMSAHRGPGQVPWTVLATNILPHLTLMACVRLSKLFYACRDLQIQDGCEATTFILSFASAREFLGLPLSILRGLLSAAGVCGVVATLILTLRRSAGHRLLSRHLVWGYEGGFVLSAACVLVQWVVQALPQSVQRSLPHWQHVAAPRTVYAISVAMMVLCVVRPFKQHFAVSLSCEDPSADERHQGGSKSDAATPGKSVVRQRSAVQSQGEASASALPPAATPASSAASARGAVVVVTDVLVTALWLPAAMVLNDGIALSAVLTALQAFLTLRLLQHSEKDVSLEACVLWALLSCHSFFAFGHHATVTSLRFEAGFVGIRGEITKYNLPLAATLVGLNTIASQILFGLGLPLLQTLGNGGSTRQDSRKDLNLSEKLLPCLVLYCSLHSVKLLVTMLAASLHRRHLMVWWVFAPRFLYEGAFQATSDITAIIGLYLVNRLGGGLYIQD